MESLIQIFNEKGKIQREDVERIFKCSKTTALRKINKYVKMEFLRQVKTGNKTYYELKNR